MSELVEGARLEIVYTATTVSGVRIPISPPKNNRNLDTRLRLFYFYDMMQKKEELL